MKLAQLIGRELVLEECPDGHKIGEKINFDIFVVADDFKWLSYKDAVKHLTENPKEIYKTWGDPAGHVAGCLFKFVAKGCGCLTQIKGDIEPSLSNKLLIDINNDARIPESGYEIRVEHLEAFKEYQEAIDAGKYPADEEINER